MIQCRFVIIVNVEAYIQLNIYHTRMGLYIYIYNMYTVPVVMLPDTRYAT